MPQLNVNIPAAMQVALETTCMARGLKQTEVVRALLASYLGQRGVHQALQATEERKAVGAVLEALASLQGAASRLTGLLEARTGIGGSQ